MARRNVSIGELAESVLETVEQERLEKNASVSYTNDVPLSTAVGQLMQKVATEVRSGAKNQVSYADLHEFRKRYGI